MGEMKPAVYFEIERFTDLLLFFGNRASLKLVVDIGDADERKNKKRFYNEYRYRSTKYNNVMNLITANRKFTPYLVLEYPLEGNNNGYEGRNSENLYLKYYSIEGLYKAMCTFDSHLMDPYYRDSKTNELKMDSKKIVKVRSVPSENNTIDFSNGIFIDYNEDRVPGVVVTVNEKSTFTISAFKSWKSWLYIMRTCDLYGWGSTLVSTLTSKLVGNAVSDIGDGGYNGTKHYQYPITDIDTEDIGCTIKNSMTQATTKKEKEKGFFD